MTKRFSGSKGVSSVLYGAIKRRFPNPKNKARPVLNSTVLTTMRVHPLHPRIYLNTSFWFLRQSLALVWSVILGQWALCLPKALSATRKHILFLIEHIWSILVRSSAGPEHNVFLCWIERIGVYPVWGHGSAIWREVSHRVIVCRAECNIGQNFLTAV